MHYLICLLFNDSTLLVGRQEGWLVLKTYARFCFRTDGRWQSSEKLRFTWKMTTKSMCNFSRSVILTTLLYWCWCRFLFIWWHYTKHRDCISDKEVCRSAYPYPSPRWLRAVGSSLELILVKGPVVSEEKMTPGHWLGLMLHVPFSSLTLLVWWQKDIRPIQKNLCN